MEIRFVKAGVVFPVEAEIIVANLPREGVVGIEAVRVEERSVAIEVFKFAVFDRMGSHLSRGHCAHV